HLPRHRRPHAARHRHAAGHAGHDARRPGRPFRGEPASRLEARPHPAGMRPARTRAAGTRDPVPPEGGQDAPDREMAGGVQGRDGHALRPARRTPRPHEGRETPPPPKSEERTSIGRIFNFVVDKDSLTVTVKRSFDAPVDLVWSAWTEANLLAQWWAPKPWKAVTKDMDFREGGRWLYAMTSP